MENTEVGQKIKGHGKYKATLYSASGEIKGIEYFGDMPEFEDNLVVDTGLTLLNQVFFGGVSAPTLYGFITVNNYTVLPTDTMATYLTSALEFVDYTGSRPVYNATVTGVNVTNTAGKLEFIFTANGTIRGVGLVASNNVKGNNSGTLFSAMLFASAKVVTATDKLSIEYNFEAASE